MEPLRVVARLANGFATNDVWSPSLDGILAYWLLREQLGEEEFALGCSGQRPRVEPAGMPLAEEVDAESGRRWWLASSPRYRKDAEMPRYLHRRFDAYLAETYSSQRARVEIKGGPFKAYRVMFPLILTPAIEWHVVGDAAEIRRLLRRCEAIGYRRNVGFGTVREWVVTPDGADEALARTWRPLPRATAERLGLSGPALEYGYRPDVRDPANRTVCVLPWREG